MSVADKERRRGLCGFSNRVIPAGSRRGAWLARPELRAASPVVDLGFSGVRSELGAMAT